VSDFSVAVVGHTGRGGYGHQLDGAFVGNPRARIVAVVDPDEEGRAGALARTGAARGYAEIEPMLERERPDVVVVAPRHVDDHYRLVDASLDAGASVYCEKPFVQTLAQGDALLAKAAAKGLRIGVALPFVHERRFAIAESLLEEGAIGEVKAIRGLCKCDQRGGGQDFIVLGLHFLDMIRRFAGDPLSCSATVTLDRLSVDVDDAVEGDEGVGPIAGDAISVRYLCSSGAHASVHSWRLGIESRALHPYRLELAGDEGMLVIRAPYADHSMWRSRTPFPPVGDLDAWERIPTEPVTPYSAYHVPAADDLLDAIEEDREPACSGADGLAALELVHAAYASHLAGREVELPLERRSHPLTPG
jgi:predicted dehydrogenase